MGIPWESLWDPLGLTPALPGSSPVFLGLCSERRGPLGILGENRATWGKERRDEMDGPAPHRGEESGNIGIWEAGWSRTPRLGCHDATPGVFLLEIRLAPA